MKKITKNLLLFLLGLIQGILILGYIQTRNIQILFLLMSTVGIWFISIGIKTFKQGMKEKNIEAFAGAWMVFGGSFFVLLPILRQVPYLNIIITTALFDIACIVFLFTKKWFTLSTNPTYKRRQITITAIGVCILTAMAGYAIGTMITDLGTTEKMLFSEYILYILFAIGTLCVFYFLAEQTIQLGRKLVNKYFDMEIKQFNNYTYFATALTTLMLFAGYFYIQTQESVLQAFLIVLSGAFVLAWTATRSLRAVLEPRQ